MIHFYAYQKRHAAVFAAVWFVVIVFLSYRVLRLMLVESDLYVSLATKQQERERSIKAARGMIYDRNGVVIADNRTVCTVSVVHNQIKDAEKVIKVLSEELGLTEELVRKKVEKYSLREIIKTNIDKEIGDRIRKYELDGVKIDEDYKRYYPYGSLASKVLGFTGNDNQGIIGLETKYEEELTGTNGQILTLTDSRGIEIDGAAEHRVESIPGKNLHTSLDMNIQSYAEQLALTVMEEKQAKSVSMIVMNPQNGEIYACVNVPEFDLNHPFDLREDLKALNDGSVKPMDLYNQMWRNAVVCDTYEPGSTFKIFTASAGLEAGVVGLEDRFSCGGSYRVEDKIIHCHKTTGHGAETFVEGIQNSCNPVFIQVGLRLGVERFYKYYSQFGLLEKTGIDLPGEAKTIMHDPGKMGQVELATCSFGQSFQLTPIRLLTTVSAIINGGNLITPHFGCVLENSSDGTYEELEYPVKEGILSKETSEKMRYLLECVVSKGGGKNAIIEGYRIAGKTATSEKLPRSANRYISSFIGIAPANDPKVITLITIDEPKGVYYGGIIAAPIVKELYENILPYLDIEKEPGESA